MENYPNNHINNQNNNNNINSNSPNNNLLINNSLINNRGISDNFNNNINQNLNPNLNNLQEIQQENLNFQNNENLTRTIINTANNSLNVLNRITSELNIIQQRIQNENQNIIAETFNNRNEIINNNNNINTENIINNNTNQNNLNNINLMNRILQENRDRQNLNINPNNMNININLNSLNKILGEMFFQDKFFFSSLAIGILLICWVNILMIKEEFSFSLLENENMYFCYLLINIIIFIFTWNFYLFLQNFVFFTNTEEKPQNKNSLKLKEYLMFSPFWLYCVIKYSAPNYLNTVFDAFFVVYLSIQHKINFIFSLRLYKFINQKITNITNIHLEENKNFMKKIRIHFFLIIFYNVFLLTFLNILLDETDFLYKLIILNKVN
jgi:hypothetical protein